jgi:hypothetical protein
MTNKDGKYIRNTFCVFSPSQVVLRVEATRESKNRNLIKILSSEGSPYFTVWATMLSNKTTGLVRKTPSEMKSLTLEFISEIRTRRSIRF